MESGREGDWVRHFEDMASDPGTSKRFYLLKKTTPHSNAQQPKVEVISPSEAVVDIAQQEVKRERVEEDLSGDTRRLKKRKAVKIISDPLSTL